MTLSADLMHTGDDETRSKVGAILGSRTSPRKVKAVRINGKKGGRPISLGLLALRYELDDTPRIQVHYSRSHGGLVFTLPDGSRECWTEGICGSPEEGLRLMRLWFGPPGKLVWFPFWPDNHAWKTKTAYRYRSPQFRERARLRAEAKAKAKGQK